MFIKIIKSWYYRKRFKRIYNQAIDKAARKLANKINNIILQKLLKDYEQNNSISNDSFDQ
jgi:hypothetical protein